MQQIDGATDPGMILCTKTLKRHRGGASQSIVYISAQMTHEMNRYAR